ncbi:MAG: radical SAM protein, partial [Candidatus Margulisbacteria bacterium]|nr:radical SAM protein [Candidatus Margulisiibacteriota bacterium]
MKAYIISLGCPKNLVDTESLMSLLKAEGYSFTPNPKEADLILVNTCAFIQSAKEEAVNTILEMAKYKKTGKCKQLIVAGCLSQRYKKELPKLLPEVDAFIGTPWKFKAQAKAQVSPWTAYVKISEGCNNRCSYCTIPDIRGPLRHRSQTDILKEIKSLVQKGVREIIFIAQDTTAYPKFHLLLKKAAKIKGVRWIRILYAHPAHLTDQVIETIASEPKIVKYLDLPIQHVSDKILKEMNRHYGRSDLEKLISKIRRRIPKIALRTSVIVGFPGESELEFKELFDF